MPGPLLSGGSSHLASDAFRGEQESAARWVEEFLAPGYGPFGGVKLLADGEDTSWIESPALALAQAPAVHAAVEPYRDLARRVQRHGGDQATTATLLAARLVRLALQSGLPAAAVLDGYRLARRQSLGVLAGLRRDARPEDALAKIAPDERLAGVAVAGLRALGANLDLDAIDVRAEPREAPEWSPGLVVAPQTARATTVADNGGVLVLAASWSFKPRAEGATVRLRDPAQRTAWLAAEEGLRRDAARRLAALGVRFVACAGSVDDALRDILYDQGVAVWSSCPLSSLRRLERATGARAQARAADATAADIGHARWMRRAPPLEGWLLSGSGPAATLLVPAHGKPARDAAVEGAERVLRAAGCVLAAPGALPGGGRWQREVASALRRAADAAPGKAPLALLAAARAMDALADDLVANAGRDAMAQPLLDDAALVLDAEACVRLAVGAAFDTAIGLLRVDGRYAKRPSAPAALRGGTGPSGSLRGMPGDLPPLM